LTISSADQEFSYTPIYNTLPLHCRCMQAHHLSHQRPCPYFRLS
jgi:hypothetical protein